MLHRGRGHSGSATRAATNGLASDHEAVDVCGWFRLRTPPSIRGVAANRHPNAVRRRLEVQVAGFVVVRPSPIAQGPVAMRLGRGREGGGRGGRVGVREGKGGGGGDQRGAIAIAEA